MTYEIISRRKTKKTILIKEPSDIFKFLKKYTKNRQEQFIVLTLNSLKEVIGVYIVSIGLVNKTLIHPREIFFHAIIDNASAIIVAHNHPSEGLKPSKEDIAITERLKQAGEILGIFLLDHLIITKNDFYSFRAEKLLA
jgi:DNA repair protein RadC